MRLPYALALAALVSAPALAQTQYADSSGGFVVLRSLSFGQASRNAQRSIDASAGYRLASGIDASLRIARRSSVFGSATTLGPTVGVTRLLGSGFEGRLEGSTLVSQAASTYRGGYPGATAPGEMLEIRSQSLGADFTALVSRPVRVVGSFRLHPTLGVFAQAGTNRVTLNGGPVERVDSAPASRAGLHMALPLSFRLFGQTASIEAAARFAPGHGFQFSTPDNDGFLSSGAYAGGGLRLNF